MEKTGNCGNFPDLGLGFEAGGYISLKRRRETKKRVRSEMEAKFLLFNYSYFNLFNYTNKNSTICNRGFDCITRR